MTRRCTNCGENKPAVDFAKNKKRPDGLQKWCRSCNKGYQRTWRRENPDYQSRWRAEHEGYHLNAHKKWRDANPDQWRAHAQNNRVKRIAKISVGVAASALSAWTRRQIKKCYWCGAICPKDFHIDHYQPLARGGKHELSNLVISCQRCNNQKHAKDPISFANLKGRLL